MKSKTLLVVTTVPETITTILRGQPAYLNERFSVAVITSPGADVQKIREGEGVPVFTVPMFRGIAPFRDFYSLLLMVFLLLRIRPDAIHSYTPKAGLVAMLAARLCFIPVRIHTFTGLIFPTETGYRKKLLILIDRLICMCATRIVPEGEGVKRDLIGHAVTRKNLEIIGYGNIAGVDTGYFSRLDESVKAGANALHRSLQLPSNSFIFCFVGRLNKDKGIAELARAFLKMPDTAHLLLVGQVDKTLPVQIEVMEALKNNDRVHFIGFMKDIRPALLVSDVLILPSYREGFPNVLLQAGSMQVPVIATNVNGCNEIVVPGNNGWLVPSKDELALNKAMEAAFYCQKSELQKMGERYRKKVQAQFEQREHWQRMVEFYNRELAI